ncbi:T9SS type A sorting domain-containing protein [candidate division KSB1 bacterium]|nr:T9SS type A sorting domain-containing protein [candidate division KSB1 bacterium]
MKKLLQTVWKVLMIFFLFTFATTFCNVTSQEMIRNGGFEDDSEWLVYDMGSNEPSEAVFGYTENVPSFGEGGCLRVFGGPSDYTNILVWQEVELIGGVEYQINAAFLDLTDDNLPEPEGFWSQIYLSEEEPIDGTDWTPPNGSNSEIYLGFNSWSGCSGSGIDGTFAADACDGKNEAVFVAPGDSGQPVLIFLGVKTGVWGSQLSYDVAIDNFSLMGPNETAVNETPSHPVDFILAQNYPNPFNAETTISYALPAGAATPVQLRIYDLFGRLAKTLVDQTQQPGSYQVHWDGVGDNGQLLASGVYVAQLSTARATKTIKLMSLK